MLASCRKKEHVSCFFAGSPLETQISSPFPRRPDIEHFAEQSGQTAYPKEDQLIPCMYFEEFMFTPQSPVAIS